MHAKFGCIVTVHLDPVVLDDPLVNELKVIAKEAVREVDPTFSLHDFRTTIGETNINLIFDLVVPTDCKTPIDEAVKAVEEKIKAENPNCFAVIKGEHPFV